MVDAMLSERDGKWAAFETVIIEPRQNGKTDTGQVASLYDLFVRKVSRIVWTAHKYKTCADSFSWFAGVCENYDHIRKRVHKITTDMGQQSIQLLPRFTGPQMVFLARTGGGGRGLDGDIVNLDEALFLAALMMGSLIPIMSAKPNPQVRYFSSSGLLKSAVLRGLRDRGRRGGDPSLVYGEWCCPPIACADPQCSHLNGSEGCQLDDIDYLRIGNPAAGGRITEDYLRGERRTFGTSPEMVAEHLRERTGWWEDPPEGEDRPRLFPKWSKRAAAGSAPVPGARMALGIDTSWSRERTYVAAAIALPDGGIRAQIVASGTGTGWVADWLFGEKGSPQPSRMDTLAPVAVGMQGSSAPVATVLDDLRLRAPEAHGERLVPFTGPDMANACGVLFDLVDSDAGGFAYVASRELDQAADGAVGKPLGAAWLIDRLKSEGDAAPLVAVTVAVAALVGAVDEQPPPPPNCW